MPLKVNVGLSRKVGEASYGSRGASVNVEMELDSGLVAEPAKLQERIRQLFGVVRSSLAEELNGNGHGNGHAPPASKSPDATPSPPRANGTADRRTPTRRSATQSQVKAIFAIAKSKQMDVKPLLRERFGHARVDDLSLQEASQLIDDLKQAGSREGG